MADRTSANRRAGRPEGRIEPGRAGSERLLENRSFHNYADHALSDEFAAGLDELLHVSAERRTAIMCSEAVWWRCHRRIIADYLMVSGRQVVHLMSSTRTEPAKLTAGAKEQDGRLVYPAA